MRPVLKKSVTAAAAYIGRPGIKVLRQPKGNDEPINNFG